MVTITINRPRVRNAIDTGTWRDLLTTIRWLAETQCRVVVLRGAGNQAFTAGADLAELERLHRNERASRDYVQLMERVLRAIEASPQAVVAVLNGAAIGGGAEVAVACDIRIASEMAVIGIPAARLGLAITKRDLDRLARLVGVGKAKWLLFTGESIHADTALSWGLVDHVCRPQDLDATTIRLAWQIAMNSPLSVKLMKKSLAPTRTSSAADGWRSVREAWMSSDLREGFAARSARRPPHFAGR